MKNIHYLIERSIACPFVKRFCLPGAFVLSCVLCALGQPDRPLVFSVLAYLLGFPLFFILLRRLKTRKQRTLSALLWGGFLAAFQISWVATTYYHGPWIILAYVALVLWIASQWSWMGFMMPIGPLRVFDCVALAACWTLVEWGRLFTLSGFPFSPVGQVLSYDIVPLQMASVVGVFGLSFWVIFAGSLGAMATETKHTYLTWMMVVLLPFVFGAFHLNYHKTHQVDEGELQVSIIQTGLMPDEKYAVPGWEAKQRDPLEQWTRVLRSLQKKKPQKLDLLVMPEAAFPYNVFDPIFDATEVLSLFTEDKHPPLAGPLAKEDSGEWFVSNSWLCQALANEYRCEVIVGLSDTDAHTNEHFNAAFHFLPYHEGPVARYEKQILVPISEYLPHKYLAELAKSYGITSYFTRGKEAKVFSGKSVYAPSICYEEGFPHLIRQGRLQGAKLLVNLTNDAWFPRSRLAIEHFNIGRIRAAENGVSLVRSCNSGVSAIVDCFGSVISALPETEDSGELHSGVITNGINIYHYDTWYTKHGDIPVLLFSSAIILLFLGILAFRLRNNNWV